MGIYLHTSSEGFTIVITIIYFVLVAKVVMVNGSKKFLQRNFAQLRNG